MSSSSWSVPASDFEITGEVSRRRDAQTHRGDDRASRTGRVPTAGGGDAAVAVGARGGRGRKRAVSRARRTVVHHRDTLARTRVLLAARAGVPVARSDARRKKDSKRGNGYVVRVAAVARVFLTRRRARGARAPRRASPRRRRPPRAPRRPPHRSAPFRARSRTPPARADAPRPPPVPRLPRSRAVASCLALVFSLAAAAAAGAAPRVVSRVAIHPDANDDRRGDRIVAVARRRRARHGRRARSRPLPRFGRAGAWTHDGAFALPAAAGSAHKSPVCPRRRASSDRDVLRSARTRSPVHRPAGALAGTPLVLEKGEDVWRPPSPASVRRAHGPRRNLKTRLVRVRHVDVAFAARAGGRGRRNARVTPSRHHDSPLG